MARICSNSAAVGCRCRGPWLPCGCCRAEPGRPRSGHATLLQKSQVALSGAVAPINLIAVAFQAGEVLSPWRHILLRKRRHGNSILAEQLSRDPLADFRLDVRIYQNLQSEWLCVSINPGETTMPSASITWSTRSLRLGHGCNQRVFDRNVSRVSRAAASIDNRAVLYEDLHDSSCLSENDFSIP